MHIIQCEDKRNITIKSQTQAERVAEMEKRGNWNKRLCKFKCPHCWGTQTIQDFIDHWVENWESKFFYSCIGRYVANRGCNWTLWGLFKIHTKEIITDDWEIVPVFEFFDE